MRTQPRIADGAREVLVLAIMAAAFASRVGAQKPMTNAELQVVLVDAAKTTARIDTINAKILDASMRGKALAEDFAKHNAEPCEYPQGHPELCANYDRERIDLNLRVADLQKEWNGYDNQRKPLRAHFAELMTRLREASYPGELASWKKAMVTCSNVNGVSEAASCLTVAVARHR
jgi:hypothetical protein